METCLMQVHGLFLVALVLIQCSGNRSKVVDSSATNAFSNHKHARVDKRKSSPSLFRPLLKAKNLHNRICSSAEVCEYKRVSGLHALFAGVSSTPHGIWQTSYSLANLHLLLSSVCGIKVNYV